MILFIINQSIIRFGQSCKNSSIQEKPQARGWKKKCELEEFKYAPHCFRFRTRRAAEDEERENISLRTMNQKLVQSPTYQWVPEIVRAMVEEGLYKGTGRLIILIG